MSASSPSVLVITGDGINCELETAEAFRMVGFQAEIVHLNDLISAGLDTERLCSKYAVVAIPGGFSFGDNLVSGKVLGLKIQYGLKWDLSAFVARGGLVIGICNGFQALIRMGVFSSSVSITRNEKGKFIDTWIRATPVASTKCIWLKGIGTMELPIRHGEGKIVFTSVQRNEVIGKFERQGKFALKYELNPTGSEENTAGLCDPSGRIFGLMPHPEAFVRYTAHPEWTLRPERASAPGHGLAIFENAFKASKAAR